jgi:hypothetical protein
MLKTTIALLAARRTQPLIAGRATTRGVSADSKGWNL